MGFRSERRFVHNRHIARLLPALSSAGAWVASLLPRFPAEEVAGEGELTLTQHGLAAVPCDEHTGRFLSLGACQDALTWAYFEDEDIGAWRGRKAKVRAH